MATPAQKVAALMKGYDPNSSDADDIAMTIAASKPMRKVLTRKQRKLLVLGLFQGNTTGAEEDAVMDILDAANVPDLRWIITQIGWPAFTSELDTGPVARLRGRSADLTGFDPTDDDSDNIAAAISKHPSWLPAFSTDDKVSLVQALFDGKTTEGEEDAAMVILTSMSDAALKSAVKKVTWDAIESELDDEDIVVLLKRTLDFSSFDPTDDNNDNIALTLSKDKAFLKKLTRAKRAKLVKALFDGNTAEDEEDAALKILLSEPTGEELVRLCRDVGGWERLIAELDGDALNDLTAAIADRLDVEHALLHAEMPWLYDADLAEQGVNGGPSVESVVKALTIAEQKALITKVVNDRLPILRQIASRFRRHKPLPTGRLVNTIRWMVAATNYKVAPATQLAAEVECTALVAENLEESDYTALVRLLPDMADPNVPAPRRVATFETFSRMAPEFSANAELVALLGDVDQAAALTRFNNVKEAFLSSFNADLPPADALAVIAAALASAGEELVAGIDALRQMIATLGKKILAKLSVDGLTGAAEDDDARALVAKLGGEQQGGVSLLARLPTWGKARLAQIGIDGPTLDEDEESILAILHDTRKTNRAELFQLLRALTLTTLDDNIHGDEWDSFLALLK